MNLGSKFEGTKRIVVVGCCGAGKSHFAKKLSVALDIPLFERDQMGALGSEAYRRSVEEMVAQDAWVLDGPPYFMEELVFGSAQQILWLDYSRPIILVRAMRRALMRTLFPPKGVAKSYRWRQWFDVGGPRFANTVYSDRKKEFGNLEPRFDCAGKVIRFSNPRETKAWLQA